MKAVIQRVKDAAVRVEGKTVGAISRGLLVYLGVGHDDDEAAADWLSEKICGLRIFEDEAGKMNLSLSDIGGGILSVSQFTLFADTKKGRRPSYTAAAEPQKAERLFEYFKSKVASLAQTAESGIFGADMEVTYTNIGPVTIVIDTADR